MMFVYNLILLLLLIFFSPFVALYVLLNPKARQGLKGRLGILDPETKASIKGKKPVWFHAASVGEAQALIPVVQEFKKLRPGADIFITTTSVNGRKKVVKELGALIIGSAILPADFGFVIRPFIKAVSPAALVIVETELWPNLIYYASKLGPLVMINGRISVKSFGMYRLFRALFGRMLNRFTALMVQSEKMAIRMSALGVDRKKVIILHNTKYSAGAGEKPESRIKLDKAGKLIVTAGSVREGEEETVIKAFKTVKGTNSVMIIAPRHLDRVKKIREMLVAEDISYIMWTDVRDYNIIKNYEVVVLDTIGELQHIYPVSDIAVIGGGFKKFGGHNPVEAALASLPVISGRNMFNFEDTMDRFVKAGGAFMVETDPVEIADKLKLLINDPALRKQMGLKNREAVDKLSGSAAVTALLVDEILLEGKKRDA